MNLELEFYNNRCDCSVFVINSIKADSEDFGVSDDYDIKNAEYYGCGDRQFKRDHPRVEILKKYDITESEYSDVCDKLEEGLSFGTCTLCC